MKGKLEELSETPANLQRLVFRGHMLKDEQTLSHHSTLSLHYALPSLYPQHHIALESQVGESKKCR